MRFLRESVFLLLLFIFAGNISASDDLLPTSTTGQIVKHTYFVLSYSENHEQPEWVYYKLTSSFIKGSVSRTDDFRSDPKVRTGSAQLYDYKGSGYDRGHLCPAGDMKLSRTSMSETFYMSNMSPQEPSFNRGIWKNLEATVRNWAARKGEIYVVTGGILTETKGSIGKNRVTVPRYYYKIVYDPTGDQKMIALILPNEKGTEPLQSYVVSVDKVEQLTGVDFFPELPDELENRLESTSNATQWSFKKYTYTSKSTTQSSGRCQAITKAGTRCKRKATPGSNYCWQHGR